MKSRRLISLGIVIIMILVLLFYLNNTKKVTPQQQDSGQIYLYGEAHGIVKILNKEIELWSDYYHNQGMRHLFVELPYYTAEFLNIWIKSDSNDILDEIYADWSGTSAHNPDIKEFYEEIKNQYPETIFHGTDIGHQFSTTGERFLVYLENNNLEDSEQYVLTQEAIRRGKYFYSKSDDVYRENMMVKNFIREFDKLNGENIMGIYGAAHTGLDKMDYSNSVPCMGNQLKVHYGDIIFSEDISGLAKDIEPSRIDKINVDGKEYDALYFGKEDVSKSLELYTYREFWRVENAYDNVKDIALTQDVLPYNNYPMQVEEGQVFVVDFTKKDGSVIRKYYRSDGYMWNDMPSTQEFIVD